jgi:hypothetical protein
MHNTSISDMNAYTQRRKANPLSNAVVCLRFLCSEIQFHLNICTKMQQPTILAFIFFFKTVHDYFHETNWKKILSVIFHARVGSCFNDLTTNAPAQ